MLNFPERTRRITRHTKVIIIGIISITFIALAILVFTDLLSITLTWKHEHNRTTLTKHQQSGVTSYGRHETPPLPTRTSADKRWRWFFYHQLPEQHINPILDKTALLWKGQRDFVSQADIKKGAPTIRTIYITAGETITIENTEKNGGSTYDWEIVYLGDCVKQGECTKGTKYWSQVKKMGDEYIGPHYKEWIDNNHDHGVLIDWSRDRDALEPSTKNTTDPLEVTSHNAGASRGEGPQYALIKKEHPTLKAATAAAEAVLLAQPEGTGVRQKARNAATAAAQAVLLEKSEDAGFKQKAKNAGKYMREMVAPKASQKARDAHKYMREKVAPTASQKVQLSGGWRFVCLIQISFQYHPTETKAKRIRRDWRK